MTDYEQHHYDKNRLRETAIYLGDIKATAATDLEQVRSIVNKMLIEEKNAEADAATKLSSDWCFVDCECTFGCETFGNADGEIISRIFCWQLAQLRDFFVSIELKSISTI